jgi:trehalose 6-phosphate synthase
VSDLVVASNRGPVSFALDERGAPETRPAAGGLAPSLLSALAGSGADWVAAGTTEGDRVAASEGEVVVDGIRVHLLDIDPDVYRAAYGVIANGTLWFLQHGLFERSRRPVFDRYWHDAWAGYREYNDQFAQAIARVADEGATVLVHDYHLALCGLPLTALRPDLRTTHFTHTPFCEPGELEILPEPAWRELLASMAAFGACGFHTARWASAYERCASQLAGDAPAPTFSAPLAPDSARLLELAASPECRRRREALDARLDGRRLLLRSDRIELSKNILRGFHCYDVMLERHPALREQVVFIAHAYGSREDLPEYLAYRTEVEHVVERINERWSTPGWTPISFEVADDYLASVAALTRYDALLVNPIRDGLNLVASEGPIVNNSDGVLVLSRDAGAFEELGGSALEIHPYDVVAGADVLARALSMDPAERRERASALRDRAGSNSPARWLEQLVSHARPSATRPPG